MLGPPAARQAPSAAGSAFSSRVLRAETAEYKGSMQPLRNALGRPVPLLASAFRPLGRL